MKCQEGTERERERERGIALPNLNVGAKWGWVVNTMAGPLQVKGPVSTAQDNEFAPGPA